MLYRVQFETDVGAFLLEVDRSWAPRSADRLYNLVKLGYYEDMRFFRVNGKVIQFGVHALKDMNREIYPEDCRNPGTCFISDPATQSNVEGTLSFAANTWDDLCTNINPAADVCADSAGAGLVLTNEVFINTRDNPQYDTVAVSGFAPVGKVLSGMDVVHKIYGGYGEFNDPDICANNLPGVPCAGPDYTLYQDGNEYFDANFPNMTRLLRTSIVYREAASASEATAPASVVMPWPTMQASDPVVTSEPAVVVTSAAAPEKSGGISGWAIAGLVLLVLFVIGGAAAGFLVNRMRKRRAQRWTESAEIVNISLQ